MIRYNQVAIGYINLFEYITKTNVKDIILNENEVIFLVLPFQRKLAVPSIKSLNAKIKKRIIIKEFNPDVSRFVANLLYPIKPKSIIASGKELRIITNNTAEKGRIFGREKSSLKKLQAIINKYFDYEIIVE